MESMYPTSDSQSSGRASTTTAGLLGSRDVPLLTALLFLGGGLLNVLCYWSLEPILVAALAYSLGFVFLVVTPAGGVPERKIFGVVFAVGYGLPHTPSQVAGNTSKSSRGKTLWFTSRVTAPLVL